MTPAEPVSFLELRVTDSNEVKFVQNAVEKIAQHGRFINGPEVGEFETLAKQNLNSRYTLGLGSGTDALIVALLALDVGPGDEVIVPCLSFVGTASAISMVGATPIFADIDWDLCLKPENITSLITNKTKVIMPVHFTGLLSSIEKIVEIAQAHDIKIIEDAAPSFGAEFEGKKAGTFGDIGCFSMNPMKVLGAWGEAGLVTTNSDDMYQKLCALRYHNLLKKEFCMGRGINARIDGIQAAILTYRLKQIDKIIQRRRNIAEYYQDRLSHLCQTPRYSKGCKSHVFYNYSILTPQRDLLNDFLSHCAIESKIYHPLLLPRHPVYADHFQCNTPFPVGDIVTKQILSLPIHEKMSDTQVERVTSVIQQFFKKHTNE